MLYSDAWGSFQLPYFMTDADVLQIEMQERLDTDEVILGIYSRYFDYRGSIRFTYIEAPPERPAVEMAMAALGPLFRAYVAMPFSNRILKPLLVATMDQLLPELHRAIREQLHPMVLRPGRRRLVPDRNPPIQNFLIQGEVAQRHMDRIEAAFRQAREADDGRLVSLDRGETVQPPREPDVFFPADFFRTGPNRNSFPAVVIADDDLTIHTHTDDQRRNVAQIFAQAMEIEQTLLYGTGARLGPTGFSREAIERSRETLVHCLSPVQRAEFERTGSFTTVGQDGRLYKILQLEAYNVEDEDYEYCCVPSSPCPIFDKMLASKLWIEAQLHEFMQIANKHPKRLRMQRSRHTPRMFAAFDLAVRNPLRGARIVGP